MIVAIIANITNDNNNNNILIALVLKWQVRDSPSVKKEQNKSRKNERTNELMNK